MVQTSSNKKCGHCLEDATAKMHLAAKEHSKPDFYQERKE